ncbi:hypothetical protein GCM10010302_01270 [Streptomyces polychromogenes]|uniref:Uncharacterized protein n=1 Tax=Streptomyces polychromogenes TaxID=67342 RepID=A0ABN0UZG9_9ACTN
MRAVPVSARGWWAAYGHGEGAALRSGVVAGRRRAAPKVHGYDTDKHPQGHWLKAGSSRWAIGPALCVHFRPPAGQRIGCAPGCPRRSPRRSPDAPGGGAAARVATMDA